MLESSQRIFCSFADLARCSTRNAVPGERKNIAAKASPNPFMTMRAVLQGLSHNTGKSSVPCSEGLGLQKTSYSTCFFLKCAKVWKDKFGLVLALYWNYSLYSPGHVGHVRSVVLHQTHSPYLSVFVLQSTKVVGSRLTKFYVNPGLINPVYGC